MYETRAVERLVDVAAGLLATSIRTEGLRLMNAPDVDRLARAAVRAARALERAAVRELGSDVQQVDLEDVARAAGETA